MHAKWIFKIWRTKERSPARSDQFTGSDASLIAPPNFLLWSLLVYPFSSSSTQSGPASFPSALTKCPRQPTSLTSFTCVAETGSLNGSIRRQREKERFERKLHSHRTDDSNVNLYYVAFLRPPVLSRSSSCILQPRSPTPRSQISLTDCSWMLQTGSVKSPDDVPT